MAVILMSLSRRQLFPRSTASISAARAFATSVLADWGLGDRLDDIRLCVSEVATNALVHGVPPGRMFAVQVEAGDGLVRVEVRDSGRGLPVPRVAGVEEESGRGLQLVAELADDWGVIPHAVGKTVWLAFKITTRRDARSRSEPVHL